MNFRQHIAGLCLPPAAERRIAALAEALAKAYAEKRTAALRVELDAAKLENELLAELNENLRRWIDASTACAVRTAELFGGLPDRNPPPVNGKRVPDAAFVPRL